MIEDCLAQVYLFQMAQIFSITAKPIIISKAYKDFENVFFIKNASYLPVHEDHDQVIDLVNDKQPLYDLIYSLSKNELSILRAYKNKNLANRFIRLSKFSTSIAILFIPKPNRKLRLCIDY